jgi:hypothetical protein
MRCVAFICGLGLAALLSVAPAFAQTPPARSGKTHFLLFDDSGSMRARYAGDVRGWLVQPLLASGAFGPNDRVIVRWFDQEGRSGYNPNDPKRRYDGGKDDAALLGHVPAAGDANGKNTDMTEGLKLALADAKGLGIAGDVLFWMLTDNVQDVNGQGDANQLYENVRDDENFRSAFLFPLTREKGGQAVPPGQDAMVLYLLHYNEKGAGLSLNGLADSVGKKINNEAVTWFPLASGIDVDQDSITVNDERVTLENNSIRLPDVPEGATPSFVLSFPFASKLRGRKIASSQLKQQKAKLVRLPEGLEASGDPSKWTVKINPTTLTIESGKKSKIGYTTELRASDLSLSPAGFWQGLWSATSEPVEVAFSFQLEDVKTEIDTANLAQVRNLNDIEKNLRRSDQQLRPRSYTLSFRVAYNTLWRRALALGAAAFVLLLGGLAAFGLSSRSEYELVTPQNRTETIKLPLVGSQSVMLNGERIATLNKRFDRLSVAAQGDCTLDNGGRSAGLQPGKENSFILVKQGRGFMYTLRPKRKTAAPGPSRGGAAPKNPWEM